MFKRIKRIMMIGLVSMSLVAMLGAEAGAYTIGGTSIGACTPLKKLLGRCTDGSGSYIVSWELRGGAGRVWISLLKGTLIVTKGAAIYYNPANNDPSARGISGVRIATGTTDITGIIPDESGHVNVPQLFPLAVGDKIGGTTYDIAAFADFWDVDEYIKKGWPLGAFAMLEVTLRGEIEKCSVVDGVRDCDTQDDATYQCKTDVEARDFMGALEIVYQCVEQK